MQIDVISNQSIVDIQISGAFYTRMQSLFQYFIMNQDQDVVKETNLNIENKLPLSEWGEHYLTLIALMQEVEESAKTQNKIELVDV